MGAGSHGLRAALGDAPAYARTDFIIAGTADCRHLSLERFPVTQEAVRFESRRSRQNSRARLPAHSSGRDRFSSSEA
jgi:hypothetical protein